MKSRHFFTATMRPIPRGRAFSLAEVVMALGIVTFAIVPLVAMLPVGLRSVREAADHAVQATILQAVCARLQQTPYAQLGQWDGKALYFDAEGLPVADDGSEVYRVSIAVSRGLGIGSATNGNASTVAVRIEPITSPANAAIFPIHVARADQN